MIDRTKRILRGIPALHIRASRDAREARLGYAAPLSFVKRDMERRIGDAVAEKLSMTFVGDDMTCGTEVFEMKVYAFTETEMVLLVDRITAGQLG